MDAIDFFLAPQLAASHSIGPLGRDAMSVKGVVHVKIKNKNRIQDLKKRRKNPQNIHTFALTIVPAVKLPEVCTGLLFTFWFMVRA